MSRIGDSVFYYGVVLPYNIYYGKNRQRQSQEYIERVSSLEQERIFFRDPDFLSAVDYFNDVVLKEKELQWEHIFEFIRRLKGEKRSKKILALRTWSAQTLSRSSSLLELANTKFNSRDEVIKNAIFIFNEIVVSRLFFKFRGFYQSLFSNSSGKKGWEGHHRTAWLVTNFFLINNDYRPFYFKDRNEAMKSGNCIRHHHLEDRLVKA